jgi:hypothetical protein
MLGMIKEVWKFLPIMLIMLLFGISLLVASHSAAVAPFIYTLS